MPSCHVFNSLNQIYYSQDVQPIIGYLRYVKWQYLRLLHHQPVSITYSKSKIVAYKRSGVAPLVYWMGRYDFNNMGFLQEWLLHNNGLFVDVGANIGSYSLIASEIDAAKVFSFEPHPQTYKLLEENINANNRKNVFLYQYAATSQKKKVKFSNFTDNTINQVIEEKFPINDYIIVEGMPLDHILINCGISPIYLKIDVEGFEEEVLEGASKSLPSISVIQVEGGERIYIREFFERFEFLGPYYVDFRKRAICKIPSKRKEDPIYLNPDIVSFMKTFQWKFDY